MVTDMRPLGVQSADLVDMMAGIRGTAFATNPAWRSICSLIPPLCSCPTACAGSSSRYIENRYTT